MYIFNLKTYISRLSLYIFRLKIENCIKCHEVLYASFIKTNHPQSYTTDKKFFFPFLRKTISLHQYQKTT